MLSCYIFIFLGTYFFLLLSLSWVTLFEFKLMRPNSVQTKKWREKNLSLNINANGMEKIILKRKKSTTQKPFLWLYVCHIIYNSISLSSSLVYHPSILVGIQCYKWGQYFHLLLMYAIDKIQTAETFVCCKEVAQHPNKQREKTTTT